jgi:hypothetical protein
MEESFSEHLARAGDRITKEFTDVQDQSNLLPCTGQVFHDPTIPTRTSMLIVNDLRLQAGGLGLNSTATRRIFSDAPLWLLCPTHLG